MSINGEIVPISAAEYSDFGPPLISISSDPVDQCLPGAFMDYPQIAQLEVCPSYMAQRCANSWDQKCSIYVNTLDTVKQRDFFRDVASRRFCQLAPDSGCTTMCQPFDPIANDSVQICNNVGSENYKDATDSVDIGWYYPINVSPDYMGGSCRETCNKVDPSSIGVDDTVITGCLKFGFCNDVLNNICTLAQNSNSKINHPGLQAYCGNLPTVEVENKSMKSTMKSAKKHKAHKKERFVINSDDIILWLMIIVVVIIAAIMWRKYSKKIR